MASRNRGGVVMVVLGVTPKVTLAGGREPCPVTKITCGALLLGAGSAGRGDGEGVGRRVGAGRGGFGGDGRGGLRLAHVTRGPGRPQVRGSGAAALHAALAASAALATILRPGALRLVEAHHVSDSQAEHQHRYLLQALSPCCQRRRRSCPGG